MFNDLDLITDISSDKNDNDLFYLESHIDDYSNKKNHHLQQYQEEDLSTLTNIDLSRKNSNSSISKLNYLPTSSINIENIYMNQVINSHDESDQSEKTINEHYQCKIDVS